MFSVSKKIKYALIAMMELAMNDQQAPVQIREISDRHHIPHRFLERVLLELKKSGWVVSTRGAQGGYQLAHVASAILVKDVFNALEGPICLYDSSDSGLQFFLEGLTASINSYLTMNLSELIHLKYQADNIPTYSI